MKYWPLALLLSLVSAQAQAESAVVPSLSVHDAVKSNPKPALNFRLVGDRQRTGRVADAGMIASTDVAPNAKIGVGLLKSPRRNDYRLGTRYSPRKAAVNFQLKF